MISGTSLMTVRLPSNFC